jgi:hypothetical protein
MAFFTHEQMQNVILYDAVVTNVAFKWLLSFTEH